MTRSGARSFHALARVLRPVLGLRIEVVGSPPSGPCLIAPNHLSYLDVLVIAAVTDGVFVSRADVRGWTGVGPLSRLGGTIYVDRTRRTDAARAGNAVGDSLDDGLRVTVFLEGKASDGRTVLPFRSSLLEPACERGLPVAAAHLSFRLPDLPGNAGAEVGRDVAWVDDSPFGAHVLRLLGLPRIDATLRFAAPRRDADRKALAAALQRDCEQLGAGAATSGPSPGR
jgi:1-acyl-sn-glycerol-3-phosphate acyltransferase